MNTGRLAARSGFQDSMDRFMVELSSRMTITDELRRAVADTDRLDFVDGFYSYRAGVPEWVGAAGDGVSDDVYRQIYSDASLTIQIDESSKVATSSSSMPSLMISMLAQLEVEPGHAVFEIGTGSGYNAALLSSIVGAGGRVVSIDSLPEVSAAAARHLHGRGVDNVELLVGDAFSDAVRWGRFDRVIATTGCADVPVEWWDCLRPGGKLIVPLRHGTWYPTVTLDKGTDRGEWHGSYCWYTMFIPATGTRIGMQSPVPEVVALDAEHTIVDLELGLPADKFPDFVFYAVLELPELHSMVVEEQGGTTRHRGLGVVDKADVAMFAAGGLLSTRSPEGVLAQRLRNIAETWKSRGCPEIRQFDMRIARRDGADSRPSTEMPDGQAWRVRTGDSVRTVTLRE